MFTPSTEKGKYIILVLFVLKFINDWVSLYLTEYTMPNIIRVILTILAFYFIFFARINLLKNIVAILWILGSITSFLAFLYYNFGPGMDLDYLLLFSYFAYFVGGLVLILSSSVKLYMLEKSNMSNS